MTTDMRKIMDTVKLMETPIARLGDWRGTSAIGTTTEFIYKKDWIELDTVIFDGKPITIAKHKNVESYMMGIPQENDKFIRVLFISLELSMIAKQFGYSKAYEVRSVMTAEDRRGSGLATFMYKWLCEKVAPIMSDREQYFGARRLWAALSRDPDVIVDVVDLDSKSVIDPNATLQQGDKDEEFDQRYWSKYLDKEKFRFILHKA